MEQVRGNTFQAEGTVCEQNKTEGLWSPWLWLDDILTSSMMCTFLSRGLRWAQWTFGTYNLVTSYYGVYNNNYHLTGPSQSLNFKHGLGSKQCCFTACAGHHTSWGEVQGTGAMSCWKYLWLEQSEVDGCPPFHRASFNFSKLSKFSFGFFSIQENLIC